MLAAAGLLAGCGGGGDVIGANPDQSQMESNLRSVMNAKTPRDASGQYCAQFAELINSIPADLSTGFSASKPRGSLTKLQKVQITGDKATAEAVGKSDTGGDASGPVTFRKENGTWKYCPDLGMPMPTRAPAK
ncbi:hypothetical protein [Nocardia aurantia]|uniref:DUF4878 domain-containing protein n=1 Tax=Nocardia aurantia TaxID=2585199 RepID=A0A7K0DS23_9NOCA|nr:hypothetical protein [Nocardia aurantia]MQY28516.1 hypothetical protein [Nocardia aurantia]